MKFKYREYKIPVPVEFFTEETGLRNGLAIAVQEVSYEGEMKSRFNFMVKDSITGEPRLLSEKAIIYDGTLIP